MLVALVAVLVFTWRRPGLGEVEACACAAAAAAGDGARRRRIGVYDGLVGPGTGSFLVFLLVGAVGLSFLHACATAKAVNTRPTSRRCCCSRSPGTCCGGWAPRWRSATSLGAQVGARLAVRRGSAWVRRVFLVVVTALVLRLAYDVLPL